MVTSAEDVACFALGVSSSAERVRRIAGLRATRFSFRGFLVPDTLKLQLDSSGCA